MADKQSREVKFEQLYGNNTIRIADKEPGSGALTLKVNVDVSEALTGLKAVQREAREAAKALRELESAKLEAQKGVEPYDWRKVACDKITEVLNDRQASQSITDDIRRSYEIGGVERKTASMMSPSELDSVLKNGGDGE